MIAAVAGFYVYKNRTRAIALNAQDFKISKLTLSGKAVAVISPDGQYVVYVLREGENESLNVRQVATEAMPDSSSDGGELLGLTFSPDGNYIYFTESTKESEFYSMLYKMPVLGGNAQKLIEDIDTAVSFSPTASNSLLRAAPTIKTKLFCLLRMRTVRIAIRWRR